MCAMYKGIELEEIGKDVRLMRSRALAEMGQDGDRNADYLEKITEYKRAELSPERFDEINKLWSVVKMNYQICNGGVWQYYCNGYHEGWESEDGETVIWDKDAQVEMLDELCRFAGHVLPEMAVENSKLQRMVRFFESLTYEESVPQYGMVECDEDEEIWDEEQEEWVKNPDYEEPYEDIVDYEDEVRTDLPGFYADKFDDEYYEVNEYLEKVIELYAQYLDKSIEKEQVELSERLDLAEERSEQMNIDSVREQERFME